MTNNSLAFIALCNEYCHAIENAATTELRDFVARMLKLLPRIYISATDLADEGALEETYIEHILDDDAYDSIRLPLEQLLGEEDTYLEVFEEDMKFSDTPIGASVAEGLADLYQVFYEFLTAVRDATDDVVAAMIVAVKEDFDSYWSQKLCNVMRPLNSIYYNRI